MLNAIGLVAAAAAGAAQPLMSLIFGNLTKAFVNFGAIMLAASQGSATQEQVHASAAHFKHIAGLDALYLVAIGGGMFVCTFIYMFFWVYTGEVNSKRIRERYLKAVLRQDIAYFDNVGAGEVATRIQTDTRECSTSLSRQVTHTLLRSCSARHVGKGRTDSQLPLCICNWLYHCLHPFVASGSRFVLYPALHRYHWHDHEQDGVEIHAVSLLSLLPCFCILRA